MRLRERSSKISGNHENMDADFSCSGLDALGFGSGLAASFLSTQPGCASNCERQLHGGFCFG